MDRYPLNSSTLFEDIKNSLHIGNAQTDLDGSKPYGVSHGLASGTATTIPCNSGVKTTWHPSLACLFETRFLEFLLNTYFSSYDCGGSLSSHSCAMCTSHSAEQASISSRRCDAGSIKPLLINALSRVLPVRPMTSCLSPSESMALSLMIRSDTLADVVRVVEVAEVRAITTREETEREGDLVIWEASFWRVKIAIVGFEGLGCRKLGITPEECYILRPISFFLSFLF